LQGEPYQQNAFKLRDDYRSGLVKLCAPSFIIQEVANALWRGVKLRRILQGEAQEALKVLQDTQLSLYELNWEESSQVLYVAIKLDLTVYHASYSFLSGKMKAQLITADNKLYEKAKENFDVVHIKDYV
jgi:predicted nucleic acid-binding protein